jgi:phage terminase large subunit-like protein
VVRPRYRSVHRGNDDLVKRSFDLLAVAGLELDDWQADIIKSSLLTAKNGKWTHGQVGVVVARQNGKGAILEARELIGLFVLEEKLIIHTAHMVDTAVEAWMRLRALIEDTPELHSQVKAYPAATGREGITLKNGSRIRFASRSKSGRRGFTADCLIFDEAMFLPEFTMAATVSSLSGRSEVGNPQIWFTGSAVDQNVHEHGVAFTRIRERGVAKEKKLAFFEWSLDAAHPDQVTQEMALDKKLIHSANPALGIRISWDFVLQEQRILDARSFAVERSSVGDWPDTSAVATGIIDFELWMRLEDMSSTLQDPVCFALDKSPDGKVSIAAAGKNADDLLHIEVVENKYGTRWVAPRLAELIERHEPMAVVCDDHGPVASLVAELEQEGIGLLKVSAGEHAEACGLLLDVVHEERLRHRGGPLMASAVKGAATRPLADAWVWSRKNSNVDISPLVASTLALHGFVTAERVEPMVAWA